MDERRDNRDRRVIMEELFLEGLLFESVSLPSEADDTMRPLLVHLLGLSVPFLSVMGLRM
jgi:hypothetical protein